MDINQFRAEFPEFDQTKYPDSMVIFWSNFGEQMVKENRWQSQKPFGVKLFTAHHLVLARSNLNSSEVGGLPGQVSGPTASKTVGAASISYDTNSTLEMGAGHWNMTSYGKMFIRYAKMFGAGAVQL